MPIALECARTTLHQIWLALDADGTVIAMDVEDFAPIGAFSAYPRTTVVEVNQAYRLMGVGASSELWVIVLRLDREPATIKAWLQIHPEIEVVARDRNGGYGGTVSRVFGYDSPQALYDTV